MSRRFREASTALKIAWRDSPILLRQVSNPIIVEQACKLTILVYIVFAINKITSCVANSLGWVFSHGSKALGQYHQLLPGDIELLNRLPNDRLGYAIAIDVCCIPRIQTSVVRCF